VIQKYPILIKITVSLSLTIFIVHIIDFSALIQIISKTDNRLFFIAFVLVGVMHILNCFRWKLCLLEQSSKVSFWEMIIIYWKSMFVSLFLPTEYGGDILKIRFLWNRLDNNHRALVSVIWARISGLLAIILMLLCMTPFVYNRYDTVFIRNMILFLIAILLFLILVFWITKKFHQQLAQHFNSGLIEKVMMGMHEIIAMISKIALNKSYGWKIFLFAIIPQLMMVIINYLYALSLNQNMCINIMDMFFFIPLLSIVSLLPISLGGIGLKEGAFVVFFGVIGISKETALAMALLNRSIMLLYTLSGGLLFLIPDIKRVDYDQ